MPDPIARSWRCVLAGYEGASGRAAGTGAGPPAAVLGWSARTGHFTDPSAACVTCGTARWRGRRRSCRRGRGRRWACCCSTTAATWLDVDYVLGREPQHGPRGGRRHGPAVEDRRRRRAWCPAGTLRVALVGWDIQMVDLGSANGTFVPVSRRDRRPTRWWPHQPIVVRPGTQVTMGRRWFRVEALSPDRVMRDNRCTGIADYEFLRALGSGNHGQYFLARRPARLPVEVEFVAVKVFAQESTSDRFPAGDPRLRAFAAIRSPYLVTLLRRRPARRDLLLRDGVPRRGLAGAPDRTLVAPLRVARGRRRRPGGCPPCTAAGHRARRGEAGQRTHRSRYGAKLADLGPQPDRPAPAMRFTGVGPTAGIEYADPALLQGEPAAPAHDVWSVGVLLHRVGHRRRWLRRLPGGDGLGTLRRVIAAPPASWPGPCPEPVADIVRDCLRPRPSGRGRPRPWSPTGSPRRRGSRVWRSCVPGWPAPVGWPWRRCWSRARHSPRTRSSAGWPSAAWARCTCAGTGCSTASTRSRCSGPTWPQDLDFRRRFLREALSAARLQPPQRGHRLHRRRGRRAALPGHGVRRRGGPGRRCWSAAGALDPVPAW